MFKYIAHSNWCSIIEINRVQIMQYLQVGRNPGNLSNKRPQVGEFSKKGSFATSTAHVHSKMIFSFGNSTSHVLLAFILWKRAARTTTKYFLLKMLVSI